MFRYCFLLLITCTNVLSYKRYKALTVEDKTCFYCFQLPSESCMDEFREYKINHTCKNGDNRLNTLNAEGFSEKGPLCISLTTSFGVNNFGNTQPMRFNFFFKIFEIECRF